MRARAKISTHAACFRRGFVRFIFQHFLQLKAVLAYRRRKGLFQRSIPRCVKTENREKCSLSIPLWVRCISYCAPRRIPRALISTGEALNGNTEELDGNTEALDGNTEAPDGNTEELDGNTEELDGNTEALDGNTEALVDAIKTSGAT